MSEFAITLEARNPDAGHWRSYQIDANRDLFGHWQVDVVFGRIGTRGRVMRYVVDDEDQARALIGPALLRRKSSPRRIGVPYRITNLHDPHGWADEYMSR